MKKKSSLNYKTLLEKSVPVVSDWVNFETRNGEEQEVERLDVEDIVDGKWVEDFITVCRTVHDTVTDEEGAVFIIIDDGRMLLKVPNVRYYRIPEDVYRIANHALSGCSEIEELDVPYHINDYEIGKSLRLCDHQFKVHLWDWAYDCKRSEQLEKEIAEGWTDEHGFVYSQDRKRLLKAANAGTYWIPEGVEQIDRLAFVHCTFEELNVPYTCKIDDLPAEEYPVFGSERVKGCVLPWDRPYSQQDEIDDSLYLMDDDMTVAYEPGVTYSGSGKRLLWADGNFDETEYRVLDGVETICSYAFVSCKHFLTLSVPSSIKVIGNNLFGEEGGRIVIRKD